MTAIIFDLDGTLIDTAPDLIETLNVILTREGFEAISFEEARMDSAKFQTHSDRAGTRASGTSIAEAEHSGRLHLEPRHPAVSGGQCRLFAL